MDKKQDDELRNFAKKQINKEVRKKKKKAINNISKLARGEKVETRAMSSKTKAKTAFKLVIYSILWVALIVSLFFSTSIERQINKTTFQFESAIATGDYKVHFIDVGQGDATLIQLPDSKTMLIDTGDPSAKNALVRYIDALNITTIDYFILTHTDNDHVGNAATIFGLYKIKTFYLPKCYSNYEKNNNKIENPNYKVVTTKVWENTITSAYNEPGLVMKRNEADAKIESENYSFVFYSPAEVYYEKANDYSPIIIANICGIKYTFTGDATKDTEKEFIDNYQTAITSTPSVFDCNILKVGHHGSTTSTSQDFLNVIKPEIAIISCGKNNQFGHPKPEVVQRLEAMSITIHRTDEEGSIVFSSSDDMPVSQSNYNHVSDSYVEWKYIVIVGGVILALSWFVFFQRSKKKAKGA